jgi:hypothetical protein
VAGPKSYGLGGGWAPFGGMHEAINEAPVDPLPSSDALVDAARRAAPGLGRGAAGVVGGPLVGAGAAAQGLSGARGALGEAPAGSLPPDGGLLGEADDDFTYDGLDEEQRGEMGHALDIGPYRPTPQGKGGPQLQIESGADWQGVGGAGHMENLQGAGDLAVAGMGAEADAYDAEGMDLEAKLGEQVENISSKNAHMLSRMEESVNLIQQRQQELDTMSKTYTAQLSDRKAFWKNPGNVISAIAFSLMPLGSNDPTVGIRLLDNAIKADWNQRKELADMSLGEMRSNIAGYRQLMGDKLAGDQMALAESYRLGALEIQRISAQYQGPKAKAAAAKISGEFMQRSEALQMQLFHNLVNVKPQAMAAPVGQALRARPGYENYSPHTAAAAKKAGGGAAPKGTGAGLPGGQVGAPPTALKSDGSYNDRAPGTKARAEQIRQALALEASNELGGLPVDHPRVVALHQKKVDEATKDAGQIMQRIKPEDITAYRGHQAMAMKVAGMKELFKDKDGKVDYAAIDKFIGGAMRQGATSAYNSWRKMKETMGMGPSGKDEDARAQRMAAEFTQMAAMGVVDFYHKNAGAALNDNEVKMLAQVMPNDGSFSFRQLEGFTKTASTTRAAPITQALSTGETRYGRDIALVRLGLLNTPVGVVTPGRRTKKE